MQCFHLLSATNLPENHEEGPECEKVGNLTNVCVLLVNKIDKYKAEQLNYRSKLMKTPMQKRK